VSVNRYHQMKIGFSKFIHVIQLFVCYADFYWKILNSRDIYTNIYNIHGHIYNTVNVHIQYKTVFQHAFDDLLETIVLYTTVQLIFKGTLCLRRYYILLGAKMQTFFY
jgi:hypothetical protein